MAKSADESLRQAFGTTGALKVEAAFSGVQEVIISDLDDSIKIGDGTSNYAGVTGNRELKTHDTDALAKLTSIDNKTGTLKPQGFSTATSTFPKQISVGTTNTQVLPFNTLRTYAHIMNNTTTTVYLQWGGTAVVGQGIPLRSGALYTLSGFELWQGSIQAICASGTANLDVMEATY